MYHGYYCAVSLDTLQQHIVTIYHPVGPVPWNELIFPRAIAYCDAAATLYLSLVESANSFHKWLGFEACSFTLFLARLKKGRGERNPPAWFFSFFWRSQKKVALAEFSPHQTIICCTHPTRLGPWVNSQCSHLFPGVEINWPPCLRQVVWVLKLVI